jgi:Cytochrome P460
LTQDAKMREFAGPMKNLICLGLIFAAASLAQSGDGPAYTKGGSLILPANYREWIYLSSGLGMAYTEGAESASPPFDNVFVNPSAYQTFQKTGTWPDQTTFVLEIRHSANRASINKRGRFQTEVAGFEVHVKDASRGGWAFYEVKAGEREGKRFPKTADCYSCHQREGAVDTTFVQFYPTLIEVAKHKGTFKDTAR